MIYEADTDLWVGDLDACCGTTADMKWAGMLHACKDPCHRRVVGYTGRALPASHPEYLWAERGVHLVLNIVDAPVPIFKVDTFRKALEFLAARLQVGPVVVHCNEGLSRAPTLALVWLAKGGGSLPNETYAAAREAFVKHMPEYQPGAGLVTFLTEHWAEIR